MTRPLHRFEVEESQATQQSDSPTLRACSTALLSLLPELEAILTSFPKTRDDSLSAVSALTDIAQPSP
jgi:hypothetical protein